MNNTTLHIKNMVCPRCIKTVEEEIKKIGPAIEHIELGNVKLKGQIEEEEIKKIDKVLTENGFELIYDKKNQIIDKIKTIIIEIIHYEKEIPNNVNISDFIAKELGYDYSYLSNLFSSVEGTTIEKYIVQQKIEKVKELLTYDELSLTEISYQLDYSSVQHLSKQFKKITGFSPSQYKKLDENKRNPLDKLIYNK
jgi:AraC family transcriptional regulator